MAVPTAVTGYSAKNVPYPEFQAASGFIGSTVLIVTFALILFILFKPCGWL